MFFDTRDAAQVETRGERKPFDVRRGQHAP
jgi:hypothetical protein